MSAPIYHYGIRSFLVVGDALSEFPTDLITQTATLPVGRPVPEGWRVLSGNEHISEIARVAYRYEIEEN